MKKHYYILILILITSLQIIGQNKKGSREKIKALKVAYLTEQLNLTTTEAEKFWPIYNKHEEKINLYRSKGRSAIKRKLKGNNNSLDGFTEDEAKKFVLQKIDSDKKIAIERELLITKIARFLSYKKILKLHISEREFGRKLMRKYGRSKKLKKN